MRQKILVTGGAGFIGSHVVDRLLADGHTVAVVDDFSSGTRTNLASAHSTGRLSVHQADIRSAELADVFATERPDVVAHLAAQIDVRASVRDPLLDADINITGTLNVLERARETGARKVIVASSGGCVYGDARVLPARETHRGRPRSPYGISKRVLHDYLAFYADVYGLDYAVVALSNVYGPRQNPHGEAGVVAIFLRAMLAGRAPVIYGDGSQTRDFVFVSDVADAFARAVDRGRGVFNIGTGIETSVLDLWHACAAAARFWGQPAFEPPRAGELQRSALDAGRAGLRLGWKPETAPADGLALTADWIASCLEPQATESA